MSDQSYMLPAGCDPATLPLVIAANLHWVEVAVYHDPGRYRCQSLLGKVRDGHRYYVSSTVARDAHPRNGWWDTRDHDCRFVPVGTGAHAAILHMWFAAILGGSDMIDIDELQRIYDGASRHAV